MPFIQRRSSKALRYHWLEIGVQRGDARVCQRKHVLTKATLQDAGGVRIYKCMGVRGGHGHGHEHGYNWLTASNGRTEISVFLLATGSAAARGAAEFILPVSDYSMWCSATAPVVTEDDRCSENNKKTRPRASQMQPTRAGRITKNCEPLRRQ
ncbi:uncharacterized protein DI49_1388 [Saccharomyces eubayanus]|uniref:uncharacterized protein n=1 Tax=Saccharomyces eubayanus TaxID=1080349 RepID=UPI0006BED7AE|nr:hypothetical protein DI49_1388 [Saccharomyces eubayanus]KOG99938.1 hypothetical protein DI49_1388 [Saccharomyces eubayanus]